MWFLSNEAHVRPACEVQNASGFGQYAPEPKAPICGGVSLCGVLTAVGPLSPFRDSSVSLKVNPGANKQRLGPAALLGVLMDRCVPTASGV